MDLALHSLQVNEALIDALENPTSESFLANHAGSLWSQEIFLINRKTPSSYTFETASALPIEIRVQALTRAVHALTTFSDEAY